MISDNSILSIKLLKLVQFIIIYKNNLKIKRVNLKYFKIMFCNHSLFMIYKKKVLRDRQFLKKERFDYYIFFYL